ncbi:uncharacterized protein LOC141808680 [Halichoeres trimaculatus]|uniref:uncharacterized protein LOC141808680 n=1 Tax=Halichoeres trimaculatus TaxID=147232 RepID=UPI003D9F627D
MAFEKNGTNWENISNIMIPIKDLQHLLQTVAPFLNREQQAYLFLIGNFTQSLSKALMAAQQPGGLQSDNFLDALEETAQSAMKILTATNLTLPQSVNMNIQEIVKNSLTLILQSDMNFTKSRTISLEIIKRAESVINETIPEMIAEYLLPGIKLITTYFESSLTASGPDAWNQIILDEMKMVQSILPPNSTARVYISTLIDTTSSILESNKGNLSLWTLLEMAFEKNGTNWENISNIMIPIKDLQHLLQTVAPFLNREQQAYLFLIGNFTQSLSKALMAAQQPGGLQSDNFLDALEETAQSAMKILTATNLTLPHSVEENIRKIVQNSLKLVFQPDMNFTNSCLISLEIIKRAESIIKAVVPEMFAEYLLPGIKLLTTYFESSLTASGPDAWNQIILDEMKMVQSLLPSNSTAQVYISTLLNITSSILESNQGNLDLWSLLEMALEKNGTRWENISNIMIPIKDLRHLLRTVVPFLNKEQQAYLSLIGNFTQSLSKALMAAQQPGGLQSDNFLYALEGIVQSAMQILTATNFTLPQSVEKNIQEIVQYSLKLILQPDMNFTNSRIISLEIIKRAESVINETIPEMINEYLLPGIELITTYFESSLTASGPDAWNQIILDEMKMVQSLLPANSTARVYISTLINITNYILESDQVFEESGIHWENISNIFNPIKDLHHLFQTVVPFLNKEQRAYLSMIRNITRSLNDALMAAEQPGGLQSDNFLDAIMETVQSAMKILTATNVSLPNSVEQNILEIMQYSLKLILQPDMNFTNPRLISLEIIKRVESVINETIPEMITDYLLPGIKLITTYFESSLTASGPDIWNQIILDEMKTVQSLLPPHGPAQVYISTLINITNFILESGQGNMSIWALFENASEENAPLIIGKMSKLLSMLWPLIMGGSGSHTGPPSLEDFAHLAEVLEQILSGKADQVTWDKLEEIIEDLLSVIKETELWESVTPVIPVFEKIVGTLVNNMQAENDMIHSLRMPVVTLMKDIRQSVNSSHVNLTEVSERMQDAIERTVQAAQQANGSLTCREVLEIWDPTREAAGLSNSTMSAWCDINLRPVLEAYDEAQDVFGHMNMSHIGARPMMVNATAARIVRTLQSVYQVSINRTFVARKLIMAFSNQLSMLTGHPLSPEAQKHWIKQLQEMELQNSLSSLRMLTEQLLMVAPSLHPYIKAGEKALRHILANYHQIHNESSFEDVFDEAVRIFLLGAGLTPEDIAFLLLGNFSDPDKDSLIHMIQKAVKHLMKLLEDVPMVSKVLEHFLSPNDTRMIVEEVAELLAWLASPEGFDLDQLEQALPKIFRILKPLLSALTRMCMDTQTHMELFEELAYNIVAMVRQIMSTSGLLGPMDYHQDMYMLEMTGSNHTKGLRHKREAPMIPMRSPMDDFIDLFHINYPAMFKALSTPLDDGEIQETAHMFFANPDLSVVMKGMTRDMPWHLNTSREDTIDAAVNILSYFTLPDVLDKTFLELLENAADMLPEGFMFVPELKAITEAFAREDEEKLLLLEETFEIAAELLQMNMTDPAFMEQLGYLESKVSLIFPDSLVSKCAL